MKNFDADKIKLGAEYEAKDKFGFRISHIDPYIIVHLEIYDESDRDKILDIFKKFVNHIFEDNKDKGIKRVYLVDSKDVKSQIAKNIDKIKDMKDFIIETPDLITGEFVPILSKIKELE